MNMRSRSMRSSRAHRALARVACIGTALLVGAAPSVRAHGLLMDAESEGSTIRGALYYTNGELAVHESVELLDLSIADSKAVPSKTDDEGRFSFAAIADHRYRVSAYGDEGHNVEIELVATADAKPTLVESDVAGDEGARLPPAWAVIGGVLALSTVPVLLTRRRARRE